MKLLIIPVMTMLLCTAGPGFRSQQLEFPRVREAWREKHAVCAENLAKHGIRTGSLEIFIRIFKKEKVVELWGRNGAGKFFPLSEYAICATSGGPGPKRAAGDGQTPEGFYHVSRFNPNSNFFLSLGIDYPNRSDRILSAGANTGGDIFIHGNCVTIGCIPITDDRIKELYLYAVEARNNGQEMIPVHIFPARMDPAGLHALLELAGKDKPLRTFWENLAAGYDYFEKNRELPVVSVAGNGLYEFR